MTTKAALIWGLNMSIMMLAILPFLVVGQIMEAVLSGKFATDRLAVVMSQTGGGCRATNYIGFIRRALEKQVMHIFR